ncbi:MAG: LysM peptidoglycan-binding domain-containing protein [Clostridium sp.]|nr:LysM peptidoglycan-binding domain-containing protein [Clostridium sp.]
MLKKSMKQPSWKRVFAGTMSLALLLANLYTAPVLAETLEGETEETVVSGEVVDQVIDETITANGTDVPSETTVPDETATVEPTTVTPETDDVTTPAEVENVGEIPVDENAIALQSEDDGIVALDGTSHVFDATAIDATGKKDKDPIAAGATYAESYFTLKGNDKTLQRLDKNGATSSIELQKLGESTMEFTVEGTANVTIVYSSTGGTNKSDLALVNMSDNSKVANKDGDEVAIMTGTTKTTVIFEDVPAGTYQIMSPGTINILGTKEDGTKTDEEKANSTSDRGFRLYTVTVTETKGAAAEMVNVTPTVSLATGTTLPTGGVVALKKGAALTDVTAGTAMSLPSGTSYELVVKNSDGSVNEDYRVTVNDKTTYKVGKADESVTFVVGSAYVNPTAKLATGSALAAGNAITLKPKNGSSIALTMDQAVKLTIGEEYTLETASGSKTKATVGGQTKFTAAEGMTELVITVESTVVTATVTILDPDGVKSQVTALTLSDGSSFSKNLLTETAVELTIGTKYTLTMTTDEDLTVELNGGMNITPTKDTTELKVLLGKKVDGLYIVDLENGGKGLLKGETYAGGAISVMCDMPLKSDGYVKGGTNPKNAAGNTPTADDWLPTNAGSTVVITPAQDGRVKISYRATKTIFFVTESGVIDTYAGSTAATAAYKVEAGETYYFYAAGSNIEITGITVDYRPSVDWSTVSAPILTDVKAAKPGDADEGSVTVSYKAQVGGVYSDSLVIQALRDGEVIKQVETLKETSIVDDWAGSATITGLPASGDYQIKAMLKSTGQKAKESNTLTLTGFILPMAKPIIVNAESLGSGNVKFSWQAVPEAESYNVYLDGELVTTATGVFYRFTGLSAGKHTFAVEAVGNGDISERDSLEAEVTNVALKNWQFRAFGSGVSSKKEECGYSGSYDEDNLSVWGLKGKGKIVPASTDGLSFYYTTIDPETENFTLEADITVDEWGINNGQEGFGLMAADRVGTHGDGSVFWNNSYMLSGTKVEYYWNSRDQVVADEGTKYIMKLGIGAQEKTGVTPENLSGMEDGSAVSEFNTKMHTLETAAATTFFDEARNEYLPAGTYNIVGNFSGEAADEVKAYSITNSGTQTTFHMTLQRNNTGYFLSYTDQNGVTTTKKFYHDDEGGDELTKLDPNNIYVGFYASRTIKVSVKNAKLTIVSPENDAPKEERPITYVTPKVGFESAKLANSPNYELVYYGNVDGTLNIRYDEDEEVIVMNMPVKADTKYRFNVALNSRLTKINGYVLPDPDFAPSKYERLTEYSGIDFSITVDYSVSERNVYYVAPDVAASGDGSKNEPMSIEAALYNAKAGDRILMMEGTYNLAQTLTIERGIDGTADAKIYLMADPEAKSRPVLDFNKIGAGLLLAGDYWYLQGFDVTRSTGKGVQVSGSYNTVDNVRTYRNGNTGLQIARYKSSDLWEDWPSNNLILNCTSYLNADIGYEDADGFAAKLTIADGNVFDGCIAAYNADDGWDLFAKIESGPIGSVTIKNSLAFKNGYDIAEDGSEITAGNGNGFKMGGSSMIPMSGNHTLENSFAFANRAKGIDSNSCPNIHAYNSISFNNEGANVAFYTNDAKNTDFEAKGIISYKTPAVGDTAYKTGENFKFKGTQDESKVRNADNYFWSGSKSVNTSKEAVTDEWFANMDVDAAIHGGITRNADGTINMGNFLLLTEAAPEDAGARLEDAVQKSEEIVIPELVETSPSYGGGSSGGSSDGDAASYITEVDWAAVEVREDAAVKSGKAQNIDVQSGDRYEVPVSVLNKIAGKKETLALHGGDGITLSITGTDIKKVTGSFSMNMSHGDVIPTSAANQVLATAQTSKVFSMADKSAYPFLVHVHTNLGKENAGKTAYLYYYDEQSNSMVVSGSFRITAEGQAMFAIYRGDEYIIAVSDAPAALKGKYVVQKGDSLSRIAGKAGITLKKLISANPQIKNANMIVPGQQINLQ